MSAELKAAERFCADAFSTFSLIYGSAFGRVPQVSQVQDLN